MRRSRGTHPKLLTKVPQVGPHWICLHCDLVVPTDYQCPECGEGDLIVKCAGPKSEKWLGCGACNEAR